MKTKIFLSVLALGLIAGSYGQNTIELTFTAENNGQYVPMDSIFVENLTQGGDTTLYAPDTVLVLDFFTGIENNGATVDNTFEVSQNYPNPFTNKTEINLNLPESDVIKITVRDIVGRELAHYKNTLDKGNHSFTFYAGNEKCYLLTIAGEQTSKTIKMLKAISKNYGEQCSIEYTGIKEIVNAYKTRNATANFGFNLGDELRYSAYTDVEVSSIIHSPVASQTITFQFDTWTPCPGSPTLTDFNGNIYNTAQIGTQCWMKENLKAANYRNGEVIPNVTDNNEWENNTSGAYAWYNNDPAWKDLYGALYNWYAVNNSNGLCPTGWHVPHEDEWNILINYIGGPGSPGGNKLKSCRQINSPLGGHCNTVEHPRWDQSSSHWGTDDYGFSGLPGGGRGPEGSFTSLGSYGNWWSSLGISMLTAIGFELYSSSGEANTVTYYINNGNSIRCVKD